MPYATGNRNGASTAYTEANQAARADAEVRGKRDYAAHGPCIHGHEPHRRRTSNNQCAECARVSARRRHHERKQRNAQQ